MSQADPVAARRRGRPAGICLAAALIVTAAPAAAQYLQPPQIIRDVLEAPATPAVMLSPNGRTMVLLGRPGMPSIAELAEPDLTLAGVRINPRTNGPARTGHIDALTFHDIASGQRRDAALPDDARIAYPEWSPDGMLLAFTNTVEDGIELWVADARSGHARRLTGPVLNAVLGRPYEWLPDGTGLVVTTVKSDRGSPPPEPRVPRGPAIQANIGREVAVRTLTGLLSNEHDERLFDYYFASQLVVQPIDGSAAVPLGDPAIIASFSTAPGGEHVLVARVQRPYSYALNAWSFGSVHEVIDMRGTVVHVVEDRPELLVPPIGRDVVSPGPRNIHWRPDAPAVLVWVEAADGGDPAREAAVRDHVFALAAPFTGPPDTLIALDGRYGGIQWGGGHVAMVHSRWSTTARVRSYLIDPSRGDADRRLLRDRSTQDRYADPGTPVMTTNDAGFPMLRLSADSAAFYLSGSGASPDGTYPFLDRVDIETGVAERLWQAADPYYEYLVALLDDDASRFITRRESQTDPPNYFLHDRRTGSVEPLTRFADPAPQLAGLQRRLITYDRADGLKLGATLFTPPDYDAERDGPLPMLVWAYPREYRDAAAASQVPGSDNRFSRPSGFSPLFLVTQGYALLDGPGMPIVGADGIEPNDTYVEQLVASARAAVDAVVAMGVADSSRIAIGGHSYGAFMAANLLAHSDLFSAGIALSGAYNRTLTPFGFQSERRSYWDAKDVYDRMSPFTHADRIDEPLLLVHGSADPNPGTYPLQSERMYQALAGHGATVRYVSLPHEGHSYSARESVMHVLAEMLAWLDEHVK